MGVSLARARQNPLLKGTSKPPSTRRRKATMSSSQPAQATSSSSQPAQATGSSSQPAQATGSSSQPVQAAASSSEPKPHDKKAARGKPLKVRKTGNIPHGVGTLWIPFTNRPFEVYGNRVYDISDLNPQQPPQE
ncbi:hypothetical protein Bca52824_000805 [Brassica carinata]|uniref:Uncharacterized protein n=1 Tax=Brassica carinata TaxID=52824 RepID=A0A8X7WIU0_BRACI|nr:hypothetical protein Bca52824_000805 [Brassica carinata]